MANPGSLQASREGDFGFTGRGIEPRTQYCWLKICFSGDREHGVRGLLTLSISPSASCVVRREQGLAFHNLPDALKSAIPDN